MGDTSHLIHSCKKLDTMLHPQMISDRGERMAYKNTSMNLLSNVETSFMKAVFFAKQSFKTPGFQSAGKYLRWNP